MGAMYHLLRAKASLEAIDARMVTPLDLAFEDSETASALKMILLEDKNSDRLNLFEAAEKKHEERRRVEMRLAKQSRKIKRSATGARISPRPRGTDKSTSSSAPPVTAMSSVSSA